MDVVDRATRSRMMAGIRGKDTEPERVVRRHLHRAGMRFRLHVPLPGKPDVVLPKYRTALFVHGCFWHGCPYCTPTRPRSNRSFWDTKLKTNQERDRRKQQALEALGWTVVVCWECRIKENAAHEALRVKRVLEV